LNMAPMPEAIYATVRNHFSPLDALQPTNYVDSCS
jgi:hypothetical protein